MKIILLQDEKKLGRKGELVEVSDGYARNYVLPKKIGVEATSRNMNDLKLQKANDEKVTQEILEEAQKLSEEIGKLTVTVKMKAGEGGRAFGSVSTKEIAAACLEQCGIELDKKKIQLTDAIKNLGSYEVSVKLHPKVTAQLKVKVEEA